MNRDKELRAHQIVHQLELLLTGMARYMDAIFPAVHHIGSQLQQVVNSTGYQLFIARNRRSGNNDGISRHNPHLAMV